MTNRGRPSIPPASRRVTLAVRVSAQTSQAVTAIAKRRKTSKGRVIDALVAER